MEDLEKTEELGDDRWGESFQADDRSVTLAAVAARAGVGKMTASRALNGTGYVAVATKERVLAAAAELRYRPNPMVQTLMAGVRRGKVPFRGNLAWVTNRPEGEAADESTAEVEAGACQRAQTLGFALTMLPRAATDRPVEQIRRILVARGVQGVVIGSRPPGPPTIDFPWDGFALATIGQSLSVPPLHYVMAHHYHSMQRVLDELTQRGYRRLGFLHQKALDYLGDRAGLMTFHHHCVQVGLDPSRHAATYDGWAFGDYRRWVERNQLDAVIGDLPFPCSYLGDEGLAIPEECAYATVSWRPRLAHVTGIRAPHASLGSAAIDLVTAQIYRNEVGPPQRVKALLLEGDWVEGATCPDLTARKVPPEHSTVDA